MLIAFLIATLVIFVLNLGLALLSVAVIVADPNTQSAPIIQIVNVFVCLIMITWNIIVLVAL